MENLKSIIRELSGTHFREDGFNWITVREDVLLQTLELLKLGHYQFQIESYYKLLAEYYEAEDELLKEIYDDNEANYWINKE